MTRELAGAGFDVRRFWTDPDARYSLSLCEAT
jgi:hypothetical protein